MQLYRYFSLFSCNYIKKYSPWLSKNFCLFSHSNSNYFNWITLPKAEKWQQQQTTKTKCKGSLICKYQGFPGGSAGKESACNAGALVQSLGWEDPLERERLPTPVFWPGEFHGLYSPWGLKELDTTEQLSLSIYCWFTHCPVLRGSQLAREPKENSLWKFCLLRTEYGKEGRKPDLADSK